MTKAMVGKAAVTAGKKFAEHVVLPMVMEILEEEVRPAVKKKVRKALK